MHVEISGHRSLWSVAAVLSAWLGLVGLAFGQAPRIDRLEIIESGTYVARETGATAAPGSPTGDVKEQSDVRFVDSSSRIPARLGVNFGIRFRSFGAPDGATAALRSVWRIPDPGIRNPKTGNLYRQSLTDFTTKIGSDHIQGYGFDESWELTTGTWVLEIWSGDRKLLEQSFTVYKP